MRAMRDLMARGVRVAVDRDDFDAEALQRDDDFLAELAASSSMTLVADGESGVPIAVM